MVKISKKFNWCYIATMIIILYYYSYRYILKYSSTTTSSTYSNTPLTLQLLKYVLLVVLLLLFSFFLFFRRKQINKGSIKYVFLFFVIFSLFILLVCHSLNSLILFLFFLLISVIYFSNNYIDEKKVDKVLSIYLYFTIIYEFIQLFLYFYKGRLPALAYNSGSITTVRFGGAIDDPNGFGLFLCLLIPYVFKKYKGIKRIFLELFLFLFLILTWSSTAVISFVSCLVLYEIVKIFFFCKFEKEDKCILALILIGLVAFIIFNNKTNFTSRFFAMKANSINDHLSSFDEVENMNLFTFLGVLPMEITSDAVVEAGIIRLLGYGGVPFIVVFYSFGIYAGYCALSLAKKVKRYSYLYCSFAFYIFSLLIGTFNLPMIDSFFNFGVYALLTSSSIINYEILKKHILEEDAKMFLIDIL